MSMFMAILVLLVTSQSSIQPPQSSVPNFSGTWTLDPAKSQLGELPFVPSTLKVTHKEPEITTTRVQEGVEDTVKFRTDGKETKSTTPCCGEVVATGQWKGSSLLRVLHGQEFTQRDTWSIGDNGQELTMMRRIESSEGGAVAITLVYRLQK